MFVILNKEKETDSVVIFLHIAKTGGSTLHRIFDLVYEKDYHVSVNTERIEWSNDLPLEQKKRIEVLRGHFNFGIHKHLPQKKFTYITLIRDPIERVVSDYYYIRRTKNHRKHTTVLNMPLYKFATKKEYSKLTSNLQTRQLSENNGVDLETAKNNLKKYFSVVGITERFNETLYCISNKLGWKKIDSYINENAASDSPSVIVVPRNNNKNLELYKLINGYSRKNVSQNKPSIEEIPKETYEIIRRNNEIDLELYKFANMLLDKQLQQLRN